VAALAAIQNFLTESLKHLDKMYPSRNNGGAHISVTSSQQAGGGGGMDTKPKDLGDLKKGGWLRQGAVVSDSSDDPMNE
jgi:transcription factor AP-2